MNNNVEIKKIFEMIRDGKISTEDGTKLIKYYSKNNDTSQNQVIPDRKDTEILVKEIISESTKIPVEHIISEEPLEAIGIDSIMIKALNKSFKEHFPSISSTVFFECHTLDELIDYLMERHKKDLGQMQKTSVSPLKQPENLFVVHEKKETHEVTDLKKNSQEFEKIAIIGMDGRFPQADTLSEYWNNLTQGVDCITEIPKERWDWQKYYGDTEDSQGNVYCKWGGFLNNVDKFDPLFFHISPKEANFMDPHERIFLETAWHAIEDAGYTREELKTLRVGVFASAMYGHYELFGVEETNKGNLLATSSLFSNIPNRVSYIMNFHGPSLFVETACSSSLEVLRLACDSIRGNECDMAIVGGVNLSLHENKYILLCQTNFLASDGRCRSFGEGGDGYVPGEACGVIVIKSLKKAKEDSDHIYGVIDGIGTNHGGKTNGYSVPNPKAQTELIQNVIELSQTDPESISYIEAHGTGTSLGDPIEINALTNAFRKYTDKLQFIPIGSVKSNIGHCEAASGMASIIKVLLMFQHKKLVPSLHSDIPNKNIEFEKTPFLLQHKYEDWLPAEGQIRKAAISAFGAGGTNLHVILEEYDDLVSEPLELQLNKTRLFVLSARSQEALERYAKAVLEFLKGREHTTEKETFFADMIYTFQIGREEMENRLCILAASLEELKDKLEAFVGHKSEKGIITGIVKKLNQQQKISGIDMDLEEIAQDWAAGAKVDWIATYIMEKPKKIPVPLYPFEQERCWFKNKNQQKEKEVAKLLIDSDQGMKQAVSFLKEVFGAELEMAPDRIDPQQTFDRYGLDSVMVVNLTKTLETKLGEISKTLFFEYDTLEHLAEYFVKEFPEKFCEPKVEEGKAIDSKVIEGMAGEPQGTPVVRMNSITSDIKADYESTYEGENNYAIVGVSGRYPMADDLNQFWDNLLVGKDCITEIPGERWDYHRFDDIPYEISKWGGFINDVNKFDPLFFQISPAEAELIDPCERLFLETSWAAMEDAGYTLNKLKDHRTGVFVGVTYGQYQMIGVEETLKGNPMAMNSAFSAIANRVSYCMNLHGPSFAVDTMCSSSLTAIHLAIQSLERGECDTAIAGGVNLAIHWSKYLLLGMNHFTSSDGRCRAFGEAGDGYVPGEGVGAVIIKPLKAAIKDEDYIYGVIKGSTINHGGKTNGYTVPNPNAQAEVIEKALKAAGVHPETISYLEAHGTGTALGDPIEISGLSKVFEKYTQRKQYCSIGSVKSNIGHLEAASGIAGLTKLLLQLKHNKLVPSIHSEVLNSRINFSKTPFYVQQKMDSWTPIDVPIRAAISAFGAGGSNAHVILEGYNNLPSVELPGEKVFTFSARKAENLKAYIEKFLTYLNRSKLKKFNLTKIIEELFELPANCIDQTDRLSDCGLDEIMLQKLQDYLWKEFHIKLTNRLVSQEETIKSLEEKLYNDSAFPSLTAIAYTLQTGRESMKERLVVIAENLEDLTEKLKRYLKGDVTGEKIYASKDEAANLTSILTQEEISQMLHNSFQTKNLVQLAKYWVNGIELNWDRLYPLEEKPKRLPLPTYAFSKVEYMVKRTDAIYSVNSNSTEISSDCQDKEEALTESITELSLEEFTSNRLRKTICEMIKMDSMDIEDTEQIGNYGFDSIKLGELCNSLNNTFHINLEPTILFSYNTVIKITEYLLTTYGENVKNVYEEANKHKPLVKKQEEVVTTGVRNIFNNSPTSKVTESSNRKYHDIAVVGMDGRLPKAEDLEEFWNNLYVGRDCISEVPRERFDISRYYSVNQRNKNMTNSKWGGFIEGVDKFDAKFFHISPFEAELMDPQQRLIMEVVYRTLENAGYKPSELSGKNIGVFMTSQLSEYPVMLVKEPSDIEAQTVTGSMEAMMANRISYYYNFNGPSEVINTACSASMAALNRAVQALRAGECEMALVGGACLALTPEAFITQTKLGVLSPEGKCKTFDADADGFVKGEGVGAILLKPVENAVKEQNNILGVIKGIAQNHGGKSNSLTAPNTEAQAEVISKALLDSEILPSTITYIETHGTGTRLGDSVEIEGLKTAFKMFKDMDSEAENNKGYCGIGSVKTNIGHLEPMSGMAGLFKVLLSMEHKKLPKTINFKKLNPFIHLENSPFYIMEENREWRCQKDEEGNLIPRRAAVSSFGIGGSNVSVIVEEFIKPQVDAKLCKSSQQVLCISAKSQYSLHKIIQKLIEYLKKKSDNITLENLAYTLITAREEFGWRAAFTAIDINSFIEAAEQLLKKGPDGVNLFLGEVSKNKGPKVYSIEDITEDNKVILAKAWVQGESVPWKTYMENRGEPCKVVIPGYQFERERYWIDRKETYHTTGSVVAPLLSDNLSTLEETVFRTFVTTEENYLSLDNETNTIISGSVMVEMVLEALKVALPGKTSYIKSAVVYQAIETKDKGTEVYTRLKQLANHEIYWEITGAKKEQIFAKGLAVSDYVAVERTMYSKGLTNRKEITVPSSKLLDREKTVLQPALFYSCIEMLFSSLPDITLNRTIGQLPFFIGSLKVFQKPEGNIQAEFMNTQLERKEKYLQAETDLILTDSEGRTIYEVSNLRFRILYSWINTEDYQLKNGCFEILQKLSEGEIRVLEAVNSL